jgi:protein tyrosine/serine phosphatase
MLKPFVRWSLGLLIVALIGVSPLVYYRAGYTNYKRLREVTPGVICRSGQLTAEGFREAVERYGIRTVINLQNEDPDPDVRQNYFVCRPTKESQLCGELGVRYVHLEPDLIHPRLVGEHRPEVIEEFLAVMDDPANYPVLLHCRAGLHRTGCLAAVYRMEYEGWTPYQAIAEMKANGFGKNCNSSNDYIVQYVLEYRPGQRRTATRAD